MIHERNARLLMPSDITSAASLELQSPVTSESRRCFPQFVGDRAVVSAATARGRDKRDSVGRVRGCLWTEGSSHDSPLGIGRAV